MNYFTKLKDNYNTREKVSSDLLNLKDIYGTYLISFNNERTVALFLMSKDFSSEFAIF